MVFFIDFFCTASKYYCSITLVNCPIYSKIHCSEVCQPFSYHGCAGNDNKYESAQDCKNTCVTKTGGGRRFLISQIKLLKFIAGAASASSKNPKSSANPSSQGKVPPFIPEGNSHGQWRKGSN